MHSFDQGPLVVALKDLQDSSLASRHAAQPFVDTLKALLSVDRRLTGTQHIEIGTVKDKNSFWCSRTQTRRTPPLGHNWKFAADV